MCFGLGKSARNFMTNQHIFAPFMHAFIKIDQTRLIPLRKQRLYFDYSFYID